MHAKSSIRLPPLWIYGGFQQQPHRVTTGVKIGWQHGVIESWKAAQTHELPGHAVLY
jgi:hypothetical protein